MALHSFTFPVGKENEHSVKLLFKFFCNNLYLGQWELARACISRLHSEKQHLTVAIRDVLIDIVKYPYCRSIGDSNVLPSHHLAWLCLQEYKQLCEKDIEEKTEDCYFEKSCEFRLLLVESCIDTSEQILKDLCLYHKAVCEVDEDVSNNQPPSLSSDLLNLLLDKLLDNPLLGHFLINSIYASSSHSQYKKNNENLKGLYIKGINVLLDKISNPNQSSTSIHDRAAKVDKIYKILSLYDPEAQQYQNYLSIRELFAKLYELSVVEHPLIDRNKVLSVIIGRSSNYLVEEYCKVEYDLEYKYLLSTASIPKSEDLPEEQKCLLSLMQKSEKKNLTRMLYLMCLKKEQHILKVVVDTCISLIKLSHFDALKVVLEPVEFQPLKPLLLLHGWSYCLSCQTAKQLLDVLWTAESSCFHPALQVGCSKLAYQIDLIKWCLDKTKPLVSEVSLTNQHQRAADMFTGLENHSVLYVLHQSTRIASLNQNEVLDILQKSPLENEKDIERNTRVKTVTFMEDRDEDIKEENANQSSEINLERRRDISIFSGYCAIKNVMDAIYFCVDYYDSKLTSPIQRKGYRSHSLLSNYECNSIPGHTSNHCNFQEVYTKNVMEKLNLARDYLSRLQPLTFRLEILQDIYSLLFVTHECIQETAFYDDLDSSEDEQEEFGGGNVSHDNSNHFFVSEDSLTSPEQMSPTVNETDLDRDKIAETEGLVLNGSYDEPFMENRKRDIRSKKSLPCIPSETIPFSKRLRTKSEILLKTRNSKQESKTDTGDNIASENGSTFSTDSGFGLASVGFLNNEYLVRDILDMLKNALLDLEGALFQVRGQSSEKKLLERKPSNKQVQCVDVSIEESLTNIVQCSISKEALSAKMGLLRQYIHEANWKFQLVCHDKIPKKPGEVLLEPVVVAMEAYEEEINVDLISPKERKRKFSQSCTSRKPSSPIHHLEGESQGPGSGSDRSGKRRPRSRSRGRSISKGKFPAGIVSLMLSSPETLLIMCLQKSNYNQAAQVTKLQKLEDKPESSEVKFAQQYSVAVRKLQSLNIGLQKNVPSKPGQLSMKALGSVAAAGVATVSVSSVAEELLSIPKLPKLPKVKSQTLHAPKLEQCFRQESCPSMILFDLLCCGCRSWEMCNNMIDTIKSKKITHDNKKTAKTGTDKSDKVSSRLRNIWDLTDLFEKLLHQGADVDGGHKQFSMKNVLLTYYKHSIQDLLKTATIPLYPEYCEAYARLLTDLKVSVDKVEHAFQAYGKLPMEGAIHKQEKSGLHGSPNSQRSPRSSPSKPGEPHMSDKPLIHNAMKGLIGVLQQDLPPGGVVKLFIRPAGKETTVVNKEYIHNLYDHLKGLAMVVAESEATSKENMVIPKNYFKMLDEGPISTIGKLMFSKKIPPSKLERVAKKLSLNLNHIIVHSCCPKIPSKRLPALMSGFCFQVGATADCNQVMNQSSSTASKPTCTDPELLVREIMTKLVFLMKDIAKQNNAQGLFDISSAKMMIKSSEFAEIITSTERLNDADLDQLKTKEDKVSFFGNLQNLMFIHMCMLIIDDVMKRKEEDLDVGGHNSEVVYTEMKPVYQLQYLNMFTYHVGQMGKISLFDLKYLINRNGLVPPSEWNGLLEDTVLELDADDPWSRYCPPPDPRLIFVTTVCSTISPAIQVLVPELLKSQLQMAMRDYLETSVVTNVQEREVVVPELLTLYKQDFSHQQMDECSPPDEGFIHVIAGQMTGEKQTSIQELLQLDRVHSYSGENIDETGRNELPFKVEVHSTKGEFFVAFDNSHLQQIMMKTKGHKRNVSLPKNIDITLSKSMTSSTSSFGRNAPKYSLTPVTLEYVKTDCPLVATLISLVCEDDLDEIEDQLTEDYFARDESLRSRTPSEISLVDIKSYRYQRLTEDYPELKRHLENYIVPIAGSFDSRIISSGDPVLKLITSLISDKLKACMLSLHCSQPFSEVVMSLFNTLLVESKWTEILTILQSFPSAELQSNHGYQTLMEMALRFIIYHQLSLSSLPDKQSVDHITNCLVHINDRNKACRMLLSIYKRLPLDTVQDLLNLFYNDLVDHNLKQAVAKKMVEMNLFSRITDCAKTVQIRSSMSSDLLSSEEKGDFYERFMDWRNLTSVISPEEVLTVISKARDYETAKKWCLLNTLNKDQLMTVSEKHLLHLLNGKGNDTAKAFIVLDDLRKEDCVMCFEVCDHLLQSMTNQEEVLFVVDYALKHLTIPEEKKKDYELLKIGSRAILCLPKSLQEEYTHLVKSPHLLLEQLLMNMKIDLAGKIYSSISSELNKDVVSLDRDIFNRLVSQYAKKALDFTVVMVPIVEKDRSQSQMSSASSDKQESDLSATPTKKSFTESVRSHRRSVDITASPRGSLSAPSGIPAKLLAGKKSRTGPQKFIMPEVPPPQDKWQPDNSTDTCMVCKVEKFSMFNRRHHCRRCGRVVCGTCSTKKTLVNNISVRTCDDCYQQTYGNSIPEVEEEMYSGRADSPSDSSLSRTLSPGLILAVTDERLSMAEAIHHTEVLWKLEADNEDTNEFTREDFYYEQAPSTSLCLSILGLHDDVRLCGNLMLDLCDDLSKHLRPIAPGVPNPEVDYSLLLSMMKTLLFHAKITFARSKSGGEGIALCDVYQSRIDLLSELVSDNFTDLPSLQELTKPDIVMRLRDNLIKDERLKLAVNVSTKCGLDPTGVWAEWGMNCLQSGEFQAAREKFSRCLRPPLDRNVVQPQPSKIIADIIDCLESMPSTGQGELQLLVSASSSEYIKHLLSASMNFTEQTATDSVPFQECLYYLKSYAPFNIIIDFYRRNGYWMKAVQYILDHKCCSDVFIEALLIPAIRSGEWGKLVDQIVLIDPSLEKWNCYLKATCKHLLKQKLHYILYEFQLIMKDFVRAAMTCITCFYQRGAESYLDLADRISYLYKAHQHLQSYLDPSQWGSVSRPIVNSPQTGSWERAGDTDSGVLVQTEEQVGRHLKMIAIQIEVTKFLHHCLKNTESDAAAIATQLIAKSKTTQLPTMFGSNKTRTDLVSMILLSSNDVPSAFELGLRIVKECKLGGQAIYAHAAREMAKHQRYEDIRLLLECLEKAKLGEDDVIDEIIGACILVVADNPNEAKEAENLIKLLRKDSNKINAFILCGKLRSAYLMAVKAERVEDVQRIAGAAQRMGQTAVKNICNKWLEQRKQNPVK